MAKCKSAIFTIVTVGILAGLSPARAEVFYLKKTSTVIEGRDSELHVSFLAETDVLGADKVQVFLAGERALEVWLDPNVGLLAVKSIRMPGQEPAEITAEDIDTAQILLAELAQQAPLSPLEGTLISTLNLLTEARPGSTLNIQTRLDPPTQEKAVKSLCASAGKKVKATYDNDGQNQTFTESVLLGPCYNTRNSCLGRCGIGCGVLGSGVEQQLTQDCLNHDLCRLRTGANISPPCDDEFTAAADDFFVAKDCASMNGNWRDQFSYSYKLTQTPGVVVGGQVTSRRCGNYRVSGFRSDSKASFTASQLFPPAGCCSAFSFEGSYSGCNRVSGKWTNRCGLQGTLNLTRGKGKQLGQEVEASPFDMESEDEGNEP